MNHYCIFGVYNFCQTAQHYSKMLFNGGSDTHFKLIVVSQFNVRQHRQVPIVINTYIHSTFCLSFLGFLGLRGQFSGCGKSGRPDILSHIPWIPLGFACVPGEVCSVFILPSVAPNSLLHTGREEKTKTFRKRTSPTSSSLPHTCMYSKVSDIDITSSRMNIMETSISVHVRVPAGFRTKMALFC